VVTPSGVPFGHPWTRTIRGASPTQLHAVPSRTRWPRKEHHNHAFGGTYFGNLFIRTIQAGDVPVLASSRASSTTATVGLPRVTCRCGARWRYAWLQLHNWKVLINYPVDKEVARRWELSVYDTPFQGVHAAADSQHVPSGACFDKIRVRHASLDPYMPLYVAACAVCPLVCVR
jgi:hypothetical protein